MQKKRDRREYNRLWYLAHKESENAGSRRYYAENTEKCKGLSRDWRRGNPEMVKQQKHRHTMKYLDKNIGKIIAWKQADPERLRRSARDYARREKERFVAAYGGACSCCGETIVDFLTCEHLKKDGKADRKNGFAGIKMYLKARREGYPKDKYTCLCTNCNFVERHGKQCPHKAMRLSRQIEIVDDECTRAIAG